MLSDIVRLSNTELDQLLVGLSRGAIGSDVSLAQIRKLGNFNQPERILAWVNEAAKQFGSVGSVILAVRLIRAERERADRKRSTAELVLTGPETEGATSRDTRVVVREIFESVRHSLLIVGYAFYGSAAIFEPLARRMGEDADLIVNLVVNIDPQADQAHERTVTQFSQKFFRLSWPFHPRPKVYFLPASIDDRGL